VSQVPTLALDHDDVIDVRDRVVDLADRVVDVRDDSFDVGLAALGLCGRCDEPSGRRCFRKAGHPGRCSFLRVSARFAREAAAADAARPGHDG
jgi:hypothetical protein